MQEEKEKHIEFLEQLTDGDLPEFIESLNADETELIHTWVSSILEKERAGLDSFFESMSQTFKYIPNFLIIKITNKYIEAPLAARITAKLPLKQAISIASGLSVDYVGEAAVYLENEYAALLLAALPKKQAKQIIEYLFNAHPLKVLDIFAYADAKLFKLAKPSAEFKNKDRSTLSNLRCDVLDRL